MNKTEAAIALIDDINATASIPLTPVVDETIPKWKQVQRATSSKARVIWTSGIMGPCIRKIAKPLSKRDRHRQLVKESKGVK